MARDRSLCGVLVLVGCTAAEEVAVSSGSSSSGAWMVGSSTSGSSTSGSSSGEASTTEVEAPTSGEPVDPGGSTSMTVTPGVCGDGRVDRGEACDDGDADETDECSSACARAACGDGVVQAGVEVCDDGGLVEGDGCDASCMPEGRPDVYLTSALSDFGFHGYFVGVDAWLTLASPPNITYSQITNDGERVYLLGIDNVVYVYSPATNAWEASPMPGPGAELAGQPVGYFKWTDQGFYYLQDALTTLLHFKAGEWVAIALPNVGSCAGSWAPASDELYLRSYLQTGFMVVRTTDDAVIRSITDVTPIPETSRTGSLSGEFFHVRGMFGPLERLDAIDGTKTSTGQYPISPQTASDTDVATGAIYLAGYQTQSRSFQRYDPGPNTLTSLADAPEVPDLSTITVMTPR